MMGISPCSGDLRADVELLGHDGGDAFFRRQVDDRAHLGAEDAELHGAGEQRVECRHRLHQADAVLLRLEPLVDLEEGHDAALLPQEGGNRLAAHLAVHRGFEQDGRDDLAPVKAGAVMMRTRISCISRNISASPL